MFFFLDSQPVKYSLTDNLSIYGRIVSVVKKLLLTKLPKFSPNAFLLFVIRLVCGILIPKGYLNKAVTANQSAKAPTIPASEKARTYSIHFCEWCFKRYIITQYITAIKINNPVANNLCFLSRSFFNCSSITIFVCMNLQFYSKILSKMLLLFAFKNFCRFTE